ncbi:hypothetical protein MK079_03970 [Candidatus Gracilibacteria bacterium]|nr:hypothetical protein [Candidatus Gracilibacteria bacterium]
MKSKITISLDENILANIDYSIQSGNGKNRSAVIENILKERYGAFHDMTAIIFAHDYKWDNRDYPFDTPKSLLQVRGSSLLSSQIDAFSKSGIVHMIILIPEGTKELFEESIMMKYKHLNISFIEIDPEIKTGAALRVALKEEKTDKNLLISNGDIFYGNLSIEEYYQYHKEQKSDFSLCLKFVLNPEQLGNVQVHGNKIIHFVEKPKASQMNLTNSGLYITTRKFLDSHNFGEYLEQDFFPKLPEICKNIGYVYPGEWEHIQNDSAYERVNGWLI